VSPLACVALRAAAFTLRPALFYSVNRRVPALERGAAAAAGVRRDALAAADLTAASVTRGAALGALFRARERFAPAALIRHAGAAAGLRLGARSALNDAAAPIADGPQFAFNCWHVRGCNFRERTGWACCRRRRSAPLRRFRS